jgi:glycosyltransferase involved in cell wall biosynthesis
VIEQHDQPLPRSTNQIHRGCGGLDALTSAAAQQACYRRRRVGLWGEVRFARIVHRTIMTTVDRRTPAQRAPDAARARSQDDVGALGLVLQVVTDTDRRGAQVFASDLHEALVAQGHRVRTVALAPGRSGGLDWPILGPTRKHPSTMRALYREARLASVLVAHGSTTLPLCAAVRLTARRPFVYRQISESTFWAGTPSRRLRVRAALSLATRVVALWRGSAHTLESVFGVPASKIRVVPNGVPPSRFPPIDRAAAPDARAALQLDPDRPTVLFIGALVPEKGVDLAIDAVGQIDEAQLLIAGDGPERSVLENRARQMAPGRVTFVGSIDDPRRCFEAADVVVLPSRGGDSMPAVLIEAGFMGVPAVATPVEGIVEILDHGRAGELVAKDDVGELTTALRRVLQDTDHATRLVTNARTHCRSAYDIAVVGKQWANVLRESVGP